MEKFSIDMYLYKDARSSQQVGTGTQQKLAVSHDMEKLSSDNCIRRAKVLL